MRNKIIEGREPRTEWENEDHDRMHARRSERDVYFACSHFAVSPRAFRALLASTSWRQSSTPFLSPRKARAAWSSNDPRHWKQSLGNKFHMWGESGVCLLEVSGKSKCIGNAQFQSSSRHQPSALSKSSSRIRSCPTGLERCVQSVIKESCPVWKFTVVRPCPSTDAAARLANKGFTHTICILFFKLAVGQKLCHFKPKQLYSYFFFCVSPRLPSMWLLVWITKSLRTCSEDWNRSVTTMSSKRRRR